MPQVEHLVHFSQQVLSRFEKRNLVPDILCKMLLNDMAPNGRALEYVQLPPNVLGLRIGIIGAKLYFQATYDSSQPDCLRVISVAPIDSAPKDVPRKSSEAKYTLPKRKDELNPSLGSVHHLFRSDGIGEQQTTLPQKHEAGTAERLHAVELDPSELLLQKLRQSAPVSIQHWRPQLEEKSSLSDAQFLKLLRVPWQKLRLANYIRLSAKQASYLSGQVPKSELSLDAREQMLEAFGMRMLNNAASRLNIADDQVADILSSLERVPLGEALRCGIWSALARLLQTDRFLVELQTVGKLLCGDDGRPPDRSVWIDAICATLEWRDGHGKPDGLKELGNKIRVSQTPARTLLDAVAITNIPVTEEANGQTLPVVPRIQAMPNSSVLQAVSVANDDQQAKTESTDHTERAFDIYGWVVRSMGWGAESYGELTEEILHLINNQTKSLEKLKRKSDWQKLTLLLFELSEKVKEWSSLLPDPSLLDSNLDPAIRAFDLARSILGEDASRVIQGSVATPSDVLEACQVMSHFDQLQRLPKWIWGTYPEGVLTKPEAFTVLTKSESREKVSGIVDIIQQRNDVSDLWLAAMPTPGQPMDEISLFQLEEYVTAYLDEVTLLSVRLPQEVLASALQRNGGRPTAELLKNTLAMMSMFNGRTSEETTTAILCEVIGIEDEASAAATAERYQSALEFFEDKFGATIMPVFEQLKQLASSSTVRNISAESAIEAHRSPTAFVTLENNWIDLHGTKAPIGFCRYPEHAGKAYGYVSVPLVAVSRQRIEVNYKLCFETSSPLHNPWPAEWDSTCPGELSIRQDDWRSSLEHHDRFFYSFKYTIPVRDPKNVKNTPSKLEFSLKLLDADTNVIVGKPTKFSWSDISAPIGLPETISWPQGVDISNVEKHPLGPQKFKSEILARVVSMSSFAVIAPRRFGKSTLLEFVEHKVQEDGFLVVRIDCTSYNGGAGHFAHSDLWSQISKELQKATGASITLDSPADNRESWSEFVARPLADRTLPLRFQYLTR